MQNDAPEYFEEYPAYKAGQLHSPDIAFKRSAITALQDDLVDQLAVLLGPDEKLEQLNEYYRVIIFTWRFRRGLRLELKVEAANYGCRIWLQKIDSSQTSTDMVYGLGNWLVERDFLYYEGGMLLRNSDNRVLICRETFSRKSPDRYELDYDHEAIQGIPRYHLPLTPVHATDGVLPKLVDDIDTFTKNEVMLALIE